MKKTLPLLLFALIPVLAFGAAYDVVISQKNAGNTAFSPITISPVVDSLLGFNASKGLQNVTIGSGLVLSSGVLSATGGGAPAFGSIASGTNTTAAMVLGTGSSLTVSGSGTNNATTLLSSTWASPAAIGTGTPAAGTFTTGVFGSTTSLLLGTAGSAVGNIGFRNATSGTATLAPPTGALGTYTVTLPNAASTLPIFGQQITFTGPSAARTIAIPDANFTVARTDAGQTFTGTQAFATATFSTSATSPIFASNNGDVADAGVVRLGNAEIIGWEASPAGTDVTLTVNSSEVAVFSSPLTITGAFSGATTGAFSGQITSTVSTGTAPFVVASTTQVANLSVATAGTATNATNVATTATTTNATFYPLFVASSSNGNQAASLLTTFTINPSTGNISTPGSISTGTASSVAGALVLGQGTTQSTGTTNITIQAPTSVTSYIRTLPGTVGSTGYVKETVSGSVQTESVVTSIPAADIAAGTLVDGFTITTPIITLATLASDDTYRGITITGYNAGATITQWDVVYLDSSSTWQKADNDGSSTYPAVGIAVAAGTNGNPLTVLVRGVFRDDGGTSWTVGGTLYLSATPGAMTSTAPSTSGQNLQTLGTALSAHVVYVNPSQNYFTN